MSLTYPALLIATIRQPEWLAAGPLAFASWVKLVCRCSEDENGGTLPGADRWSEHVWLTYANVSVDGVDAAVDAGLCTWDGSTLVVNGYDHGAQAKVQRLRGNAPFGVLGAEHGRKGGRPRKGAGKTPENPQSTADASPGVLTPQGSKGAGQQENPTSQHQETPIKTPSGGLGKPPLTLPSPSDPFPTGPSPAPPPAAKGTGTGFSPGPPKPPPRVWDSEYWFRQFSLAWCERKQRLRYGMGGTADARARADLGDILRSLAEGSEAELLKAQAVAPKMFALFLDEEGRTAEAAHPWSWFVSRFNGYFARAAAKGGTPLRVVRDEVPDLPPASRRPGPEKAPGGAPAVSAGGGEGGGTIQGIASRAT